MKGLENNITRANLERDGWHHGQGEDSHMWYEKENRTTYTKVTLWIKETGEIHLFLDGFHHRIYDTSMVVLNALATAFKLE